jgi:hypothetical protein
MWKWLKRLFYGTTTRTSRFLEWKEMEPGSEYDYNWWCPYCKRWVVNGLFAEGGEWERKSFSNGRGDVRYYDTGNCKKCGANIHVDEKWKKQLEGVYF